MQRSKLYCITGFALLVVTCTAVLGENTESPCSAKDSQRSCLRAVSLRVLQQRLKRCLKTESCATGELYLGDITQPLGFSIDQKNNDVLLIGLPDTKRPPIYTEDFVTALRSSYLKYARVTGNTIYVEYPGCSIDPRGGVIKQLDGIARDFMSGPSNESSSAMPRKWREACEAPQDVRVLGVPFESHFAHIMVTADYHMKKIADGSDELDVPGLMSVSGMGIKEVEHAIHSRQQPAISVGMNRFWFFPGPTHVSFSASIAWIRELPVIILTRPTGMTSTGTIADTSGEDPHAQAFASSFSILYDKVAYVRPIYRELESLFRIIALTTSLHDRNAFQRAGLNVDYFLDDMPTKRTRVPKTLPGKSAVATFEHKENIGNGIRILKVWLPSCGGVEMRFDRGNTIEERDTSGALDELSLRMESLPAHGEVVRDVVLPGNARLLTLIEESNKPPRDNAAGPTFLKFVVNDKGDRFTLTDGETTRTYQLHESRSLLGDLTKAMQDKGVSMVYLTLEGFQPHKEEAFRLDLDRQKLVMNFPGYLSLVKDGEVAQLLFSKGLRREGPPPRIEQITEGPRAGWYRAVVSFVTRIGEKLYRVSIVIIAKTAEAVDNALQRINIQFSVYNQLPISMADLAVAVRSHSRQGQAHAGEPDEDIVIQIQDPAGHLHTVERSMSATRG